MNGWMTSLASGAVGAAVLTLIHETARRQIRHAPRMDVVAMRGLCRILPPGRRSEVSVRDLHRIALAGDLVANAVYYSAIPADTSRATWTRAAVLGAAAGLGALLLPEPMGLGVPPGSHVPANQAMTIGWYMAGAAATAAIATAMKDAGRSPAAPVSEQGLRVQPRMRSGTVESM